MTKAKASAATTTRTSQTPDDFAPIPIRRAGPSRAMPPVSAALNGKGDLVLVFSPAFMAEHRPPPSVLVSWSPATRLLRLAAQSPAGESGTRKIRRRPSCPGAGELRLSALSLADLENFPALGKRRSVAAVRSTSGVILISFDSGEEKKNA